MTSPTSSEQPDYTEREGIPFIGAGPGDPELLTVAGRQLVTEADLVVHAGSLVNSELLDEFCADAEQVNSIGKDLEELIPLMTEAYTNGRTVARLHSGDPAIYGAALEQMDALAAEDVPTYLVHIDEFVGFGDTTVCIYLGTHAVAETMDRLLDAGHDPEIPVAVVYHASWPDEDVIKGTIGSIAEKVEAAGYRASALVIIGEAITGSAYERSYLYGDWASGSKSGDNSNDTTETTTESSPIDANIGANGGESNE